VRSSSEVSSINAHAPYCHLWSDPLYSVFPHYLIKVTIFEEKLLDIKCVFWCHLQLLSETFLILRRIEGDMLKISGSLHVQCPLFQSDFHETCIFLTVFRKILKYLVPWKSRPMGAELFHADRRTDMTKLKVAFRNFANASKNGLFSTVDEWGYSKQRNLTSTWEIIASLVRLYVNPAMLELFQFTNTKDEWIKSNVYWTVHHCNSWGIRNQLDVTAKRTLPYIIRYKPQHTTITEQGNRCGKPSL